MNLRFLSLALFTIVGQPLKAADSSGTLPTVVNGNHISAPETSAALLGGLGLLVLLFRRRS